MQHYLTLLILCLFGTNKKIVWDLHELPHKVLVKFYLTRKAIKFILDRVDLLVYTNNERRNYILNNFKHKEKNYSVLNNYPLQSLFLEPKTENPKDLKEWLDGNPYIIWLGNGVASRNFLTFIEAVAKQKANIKVVVLGKLPKKESIFVEKINMKSRIFDTFVNPEEMKNYIDQALFSVVLYKNITPNNWLCEPNRLYQLTSRNIPIISGNNPPLKNFVEKFKAGIVLQDDGSNIENLSKTIQKMLIDYPVYKKNLEKSDMKNAVSWEEQFKGINEKLAVLCQ